MAIKAVLFDAFKTLIDLRPSMTGAFSKLCADYGYEIPEAKLKNIFATVEKNHAQNNSNHEDRFKCTSEILHDRWIQFNHEVFQLAGVNGDSTAMTLAREMERRFNTGQHSFSYADSFDTLKSLREQNLRLGIVSNGTAGVVNCLKELGYSDKVDFILVSALVGWEKPSPRIFSAAIENAAVQPHEILFIGDNYDADVIGAQHAGMQALLIDRERSNRDWNCDVIYELSEIKNYLG